MDYNALTEIIQKYVNYGGPIAGIAFPAIEALLPVIPLFIFVIINVNVFGLFRGYLY